MHHCDLSVTIFSMEGTIMAHTIQKVMSIAETMTDLVIDKLLDHTKLKEIIDQRVETKLKYALANLEQPSVDTRGFYRVMEIVRHPKNPNPLLPISRASFLAKVKTGEYPQPVKIGPKTTAWKKEDIAKLIKYFESKKK